MIVLLMPSYEDTFWKIRLACGYKELFQKLCSLSEEAFPKIYYVVYPKNYIH